MANIIDYPDAPFIGKEVTIGATIKRWDGEKWVNKSFGNHELRLQGLESFEEKVYREYSRVFVDVASLKASVGLQVGDSVKALRYRESQKGVAGLQYEIYPAGTTADGYLDHGITSNGTVAVLIRGSSVSVMQAGCYGDGVTDDTLPFKAAIDTGRRVLVPKGNYAINVDIEEKLVLEGEGNLNSRLTPFDSTKSALNYTFAAQVSRTGVTGVTYFDFHSEIRNIGFYGVNKQGIGFSFGKPILTDFEDNDNFANNVKFYGCHFDKLDKGVQFSFGNIGSEFYSCGFKENYYGVYSLNNKQTGSLMHAGNKHFYGGEFNSNSCAVYVHNGDAVGYGDFVFHNTILEANLLVAYVYNTSAVLAKPTIQFDGVWLEANGAKAPPAVASAQVALDSWTGSTKGTQILDVSNMIFDGSNLYVTFDNCGGVGDLDLLATNSSIYVTRSFVVEDLGNGANVNTVADPSSSYILLEDCFGTDTSIVGQSVGTYTRGAVTRRPLAVDSNSSRANARWSKNVAIRSKSAATPASLILSNTGVTPMSLGNGSFNLSGTGVSDGVVHSNCTEFTVSNFLSSALVRINAPTDTSATLGAGYHVLTFSSKVLAGSVDFLWWNRGADSMATSIKANNEGRWITYAALAYTDTNKTVYLDCRGNNEDVTWRMADIQIHTFDTLLDARTFMDDGVYYE